MNGHEKAPIYGNAYQPAYYQSLFETSAFRFILNNTCLNDRFMKMCKKKYKERSDKILEDPGYSFRHMKKNKMFEYAEDFRTIYNKAWVTHNLRECRIKRAQLCEN